MKAEEMKALLDTLPESQRVALVDVAAAERWAQVREGTFETLLLALAPGGLRMGRRATDPPANIERPGNTVRVAPEDTATVPVPRLRPGDVAMGKQTARGFKPWAGAPVTIRLITPDYRGGRQVGWNVYGVDRRFSAAKVGMDEMVVAKAGAIL